MKRRILSPAQILLLLALAGLVLVLVLQAKKPNKAGPAAPSGASAFADGEVEEVRFERANVSVKVVREADGYWIAEPYRDRADDAFLAQSIKVASSVAPLRTLPDTAGAPFGLAPARARWSCRWRGGSFEIMLGDSLPTGGGRFARVGRDPHVVIVDSFLARRYLSPPVAEIHAPAAALLDVGPIDSLRIQTREENLVAVRHRADFWEFVRPVRMEGSAPQLARAVQALRTDGLTEFLGPTQDRDLKKLGLDPPRAVWTLVQGSRRREVRIGHPTADESSVYVIPAGRDVVALISSENFRQWVDGISRLRESLLLPASGDSVVQVDAESHGRARRFVRSSGGIWSEATAGETLAVRSGDLARLVLNTCQLRAISFDQGPPPHQFAAEIRLLLRGESGRTDTLRIEEPQEAVSRAWSRRQPGVSRISGDAYRAWTIWTEHPLRP